MLENFYRRQYFLMKHLKINLGQKFYACDVHLSMKTENCEQKFFKLKIKTEKMLFLGI